MNLDAASNFSFGDRAALQQFFMAHRFVHEQEATALTAKYRVPQSTFGVSSSAAEEAWASAMRDQDAEAAKSPALTDWLQLHATIHNQTYFLLTGSDAPDLSTVDFSDPGQFYQWMYAHQTMHDYEQSTLQLT